MHYQKVCLENITLPKCLPKCEGSKIVSLIQDSIDVKAQTESRFTMEKLNEEYKIHKYGNIKTRRFVGGSI